MAIQVKQKVESRLTLGPTKKDDVWRYGGLVPAKLVLIELSDAKVEKGEFAGMTVKNLRFEFESISAPGDPISYLTHVESLVGTQERVDKKNKDNLELMDMPDEKIDKFTNEQFVRFVHLNRGMKGSPAFKDLQNSITAAEIKKYIDPVNPKLKGQKRVDVYDAYLEFIYEWFLKGKGGKPQWQTIDKDKNPQPIFVWLRLEPSYPKRNYYEIPNLVGKGFIEPLYINSQAGILPAKVLKITKPEYLELGVRKNKKANDEFEGAGSDVSQQITDALFEKEDL